MSIEFKNSRYGRNRKSRLFKKTRRAAMKKIDAPHLPMRVQTNKNGYWEQTSKYPVHTPYGKIHKFLKARVGQSINKVFSEFLVEARKFRQADNLEEAFYSCISYDKDKHRGYFKGFYISNGILNYRNDWIKNREEPTPEKFTKYNEEHWNESIFNIFKPLHNTGPYPIGKFWVEVNGNYMLLPIYAVYKGKWDYGTKEDDKIYSQLWKVRKKVRYDYLKEFSRCTVLGKGIWFKILKSFISPADWHGYGDYNYFYYIVRNSDIEKYKRKRRRYEY